MGSTKLTDELRHVLSETSVPLVAAYLFGSHASGKATADSDVDVGVLLGTPVDEEGAVLVGPLSRLRGELERALEREVDLVDMREAPPDLIHRILRDGVLLIERDPKRRIEFEVQARNAYFDILPYLREYRRGQAA